MSYLERGKDRPFARSQSHGTKSDMLVSKLHSGTSKTKPGPGRLVRVALFWKSHCATCSPARVILYHETGSCKGPVKNLYFHVHMIGVNFAMHMV